uniref:G_PROTEIN_RECEP_F1_2 domain-containing protein n=1 Tax=Haemonchus placei TaxID=6290 RepID=A0A0N4W4V8_HAEPC
LHYKTCNLTSEWNCFFSNIFSACSTHAFFSCYGGTKGAKSNLGASPNTNYYYYCCLLIYKTFHVLDCYWPYGLFFIVNTEKNQGRISYNVHGASYHMNETEVYPDYDDLCAVEISDRRFYMAVAGTILSLISLFCNLLIAKVLYSSKHAHFFFLALLAVSDCFLSLMYGPVIAMDIIKDKVQILWLTQLYWWYVGPLLALCQVSMTFSCYLIILATIERYLITQRSSCLKRFRRSRGLMALFMFMLSLLLRGTLVFEIQKKNMRCEKQAI